MIFQGLFNIIDLYINEIDLFYESIDWYIKEKIDQTQTFKSFLREKIEKDLKRDLQEIIKYIIDKLEELGFDKNEIAMKFTDQDLNINPDDIKKYKSGLDLYKIKVAPIVHEIFLESILKYLVDINSKNILEHLKEKDLLPSEFIIKLGRFRNHLRENHEKLEHLKKYILIREKIIQKLSENKKEIEAFQHLDDKRIKIQFSFLIFRIIDFFHLEKLFDFSYLKEYLKENLDDWLDTIPLITLKNPDLYYCGIYLSNKLNIEIDEGKVKSFLLNLFDEIIDEFESPIIQATDQVYYFLKSISHMKMSLSNQQLSEILYVEENFFESSYLENLETSQLVVILKNYNYLGVYSSIENSKINSIINEIDKRITPQGIQQFRDGLITSEATYYVLFVNYMMNSLNKLKDFDILDSIISRIYRNLELIEFYKDMNFDLISELFYSCESLKLFNCIETRQMRDSLVAFLFPEGIKEDLDKNELVSRENSRFRHFKVNRTTGETIHQS